MFENYVNYAGSKTLGDRLEELARFENYVNYAGSKTCDVKNTSLGCLRTM